jgi:hypothetical protein
MAKFVLKNASVVINSVDLSDHVKSVTVDYAIQENAQTTMGDTYENFIAGTLKIASLDFEFTQDYASGKVDATLNGLLGVSTVVTVKPVATTVGPTNPRYYGNMMLTKYTPMGGSVGDTSMAPAHFVCCDGTGLTRAEA